MLHVSTCVLQPRSATFRCVLVKSSFCSGDSSLLPCASVGVQPFPAIFMFLLALPKSRFALNLLNCMLLMQLMKSSFGAIVESDCEHDLQVAVEDIIADGRLRLAVTPVFDESQLAAALQVSVPTWLALFMLANQKGLWQHVSMWWASLGVTGPTYIPVQLHGCCTIECP